MANVSATAVEKQKSDTIHATARRTQHLAAIIHRAFEANASGAAIALVKGNELIAKASSGNAPDPEASTALESSFTGLCVRTGERLHCVDVASDPRVNATLCEQMEIRSIVVVPLKNNAQTLGVLAAFASTPGAFSPADISLLEGLAEQARETIWPCEANAAANPENSTVEPITGLSPSAVAPARDDGDFSQILATILAPSSGAQHTVEITDEEIVAALAQIRPDTRRQAVPAQSAEEKIQDPTDALKLSPHKVDAALAIEVTGQAPPTERDSLGTTGSQEIPVNRVRPYVQLAVKPSRAVGVRRYLIIAALVVLGLCIGSYFAFRSKQQLPRVTAAPQAPPLSVISGEATSATAPTQTVTSIPTGTKSNRGMKADRAANQVLPATTTPRTDTPVILATNGRPVAETTVEQIAPPSNSELIAATGGEQRPRLPTIAATPSLGTPAKPVPPKPISRIDPLYPKAARLLNVQGPVVLALRISPQGKVVEAMPISGPELLRAAAISAVMQWTYKPASLNGNPVESSTRVEIDFKLR